MKKILIGFTIAICILSNSCKKYEHTCDCTYIINDSFGTVIYKGERTVKGKKNEGATLCTAQNKHIITANGAETEDCVLK